MASLTTHSSPETNDFSDAFPGSRKIYVDGERVRVPMREISLSGGESPQLVYDTSGQQGIDVREGLPTVRKDWIAARGAIVETRPMANTTSQSPVPSSLNRPVLRGTTPVTQMHYARKGIVTAEMEFVALREGFDPDFVRSEVARGRAIIPGNINHPEIEPMAIGRYFLVKINANIGILRLVLLSRLRSRNYAGPRCGAPTR